VGKKRNSVECGLIGVWSDEHIGAGEDWRKNIQAALATTRVALLLVSDYIWNTDFITRIELLELMSAAKNARVSIRWYLSRRVSTNGLRLQICRLHGIT
jgi:hypothetical protein